tara:strand:+ start:1840 stop:2658 length:819 start_codon:yes stop_codon:yes gene_type:complete
MKYKKTKMTGVTMLEVLLVLAIGSAMIIAALRLNQTFKREAEISTLRFNVDQIFQAAAGFYQANCRVSVDPETGIVPDTGLLATPDADDIDPANRTIVAVPIADLKSFGFLNTDVTLASPFVRTTLDESYIVQFNQLAPVTREITLKDDTKRYGGKIVMWKMQVAVELRDQSAVAAERFKVLLDADCLSTLNDAGDKVIPCSLNPVPEDDDPIYVVWERLPSYATEGQLPNMWTTNANVKSFTNMYTISHTIYKTTNDEDEARPAENYLCGG